MRFPTPVYSPDAPTTPAATGAAPETGTTTTSTPSATSTEPGGNGLPSTPTDSSSKEGVDSSSFDFMFNQTDEDPGLGLGLSPPETAHPEPKPAQPAPATPEKPAAKVEEPKKPEGTAAPAPTEAASPTTATQPSPTLDPYDPGTLAAHLAQNEEQVIQQLADSTFKLSDKDVEDLEANTIGTIPRLLSKVAVTMQRNFLMQMANIVPRMVQAHGEVSKRHNEAENAFYSRWPDLKKDQHGETVMKYAAVYRQMHPEASRQDMIEAVGPMVMMAAKVQPSAQPQTAATQASPMVNGVRPPQPAPFVPAGPSAGGASMSTAPQLSPVEAMFVGQEE